jgi:hypothetical protein
MALASGERNSATRTGAKTIISSESSVWALGLCVALYNSGAWASAGRLASCFVYRSNPVAE